MIKQYHLKYKQLNKKAIKLISVMINEGSFFKRDKSTKEILLNIINQELSKIYHIKTPYLEFNAENDGYYNQDDNTINLNSKLSLVTFLHEFKHAIQYLKGLPNNEEIARGWSLSLFYLASPKHFENAVRKGLIFHQKEIVKWFYLNQMPSNR